MGCCFSDDDDDDENQFFDAGEEFAVASDSIFPAETPLNSDLRVSSVVQIYQFDVWIQSPESIQDRRRKFLMWFGSSVNYASEINLGDTSGSDGEHDRITTTSGATRSSSLDKDVQFNRLSLSDWSTDNSESSGSPSFMEDNMFHFRSSDRKGEAGSGHSFVPDFLDQPSKSSSWVGDALESGPTETGNRTSPRKRVNKWWINKLRSYSCVGESIAGESNSVPSARPQRVKVCHSSKQSKELSALYLGQDIPAHTGSITTMKFSPDGQYLASAGEDGIVRVWQVVEDDRSIDLGFPDIDPSCVYFTLNHFSELKSLGIQKERTVRKTSDTACVVIPPKVFRLLEKPLHEFQGHKGKILYLSWSKSNHLLSSSVDKTVRLWQVGSHDCLKVFLHSNYVTCAQFNPLDDNFFISGSIDGKVRIWEISGCHVVNWADIKDIITAVSYHPDGKGGIVGTLTGRCRLFSISGNNLLLDSQISFHSKRKSFCKRITGFQYVPQDSNKIMVTCADSQIRILHGTNVISKYKGSRNAANCLSASFTSDGKHIISASEDCNVCVWNCIDHHNQDHSRVRKISSYERFPTNASVAIPWHGLRDRNTRSQWQFYTFNERTLNSPPFPPHTCFTRSQDFLEFYPKGSATWPEERLMSFNQVTKAAPMDRAEYKLLKRSLTTSNSHAWGLVILTGGWDGRIRSFINYGLPAS